MEQLPPLLSLLGRTARAADLVGEWLLTYAVHSTALILAAWALVTVMRGRWSPSAQAAIWRASLVAGWVTATLQLAAPWRPFSGQLQLPMSSRQAFTAVHVETAERTLAAPAAGTLDRLPSATPLDWTGRRVGPTFATLEGAEVKRVMVVAVSFASLAVASWSLVAALLAAHLAWLRRRLQLAIAGRHDARLSLAGFALQHLQRQAGVSRPVALSVSDVLAVPAALPGDEIVLPRRAVRELTLAEQEAVLAHELAHVVRRDTGWLQLARWIERVAWFQPLNRVARRQMQLSAEYAADAWAARLTGQPLRLAQALARVASWRGAGARDAAYASAMAADGSPLVDRVRQLTMPGRASASPLGGTVACGAMGALAAAALLLLPRVELGRPAPVAAPAEARVRLHLSERVGVRPGGTWREADVATVTLGATGGSRLRIGRPAERARPQERGAVDEAQRQPAWQRESAAPSPKGERTLILVRRGAGTAS